MQHDLAVAQEYSDSIEKEDPQTRKEEAEVMLRMEIVQHDIEGLVRDVADAEKELTSRIEHWGPPS